MKKGFSFGFLAVSLIMLLHVHVSTAIPWKTNATAEDYLVHNQWDEEEFSLDSHFRRMLYAVSQSQVGRTGNRGHPAPTCKRVRNYRGCLPDPNTGGRRQRCNDYNRAC